MARELNQNIFVAGHRGMVGSAIVRRLQTLGYTRIVTAGRDTLNLLDQQAVQAFFQEHRSIRCIWLRQRWAVFRRITPTRLTSSTKT